MAGAPPPELRLGEGLWFSYVTRFGSLSSEDFTQSLFNWAEGGEEEQKSLGVGGGGCGRCPYVPSPPPVVASGSGWRL